MKFAFDLAANRSLTKREYFALKDRGFNLLPIEKSHPGSHLCRFLLFKNPTQISSSVQTQRQYLEFCEVLDVDSAKSYFESINANQDEHFSSVFYLSCNAGLSTFFHSRKNQFSNFGINFLHKNYDWKVNSEDYLPGWNFIYFKKNLVNGIQCSLAEYEHSLESNAPDASYTIHPNSVFKIMGVIWTIESEEQLQPLCQLISKQVSTGEIELDDGTKIWITTKLSTKIDHVFTKKTSFSAVVLACKSFDTCLSYFGNGDIITFLNKRAILIKHPEEMWDIVITESL